MTDSLFTSRRWLFWITMAILTFVFIYLIRSVLLPFVLGMFAAYFLDPAADRLEKMKFSRTNATLVITTLFFLGIVLLGLIIIPVIISQASGLIAALPGYINEFDQTYSPQFSQWLGGLPAAHMDSIKNAVADFSGIMVKLSGEFIAGLFQSGMALVTLLSLVLITPVVTFYLLRDWDYLVARMDNLLPRPHADTIRAQLAIIDTTLAGLVRGQLNVCLILATYYAIGLSIAGLKFGIVIGLLTGFLVIFPYVGFLLGMLVGMAVACFQFDSIGSIGMVFAVFMVGTILEGSVITPKLVGEKVGLHPVWIIFGMLSGAALFGLVGVLLAVPATAVIGVVIRFATRQYLQSSYYNGESTAPRR